MTINIINLQLKEGIMSKCWISVCNRNTDLHHLLFSSNLRSLIAATVSACHQVSLLLRFSSLVAEMTAFASGVLIFRTIDLGHKSIFT